MIFGDVIIPVSVMPETVHHVAERLPITVVYTGLKTIRDGVSTDEQNNKILIIFLWTILLLLIGAIQYSLEKS